MNSNLVEVGSEVLLTSVQFVSRSDLQLILLDDGPRLATRAGLALEVEDWLRQTLSRDFFNAGLLDQVALVFVDNDLRGGFLATDHSVVVSIGDARTR